ncbi:MAG: polysaccharide biosynthesis/export family protein, partial [Bryobacteraceae bacterium]
GLLPQLSGTDKAYAIGAGDVLEVSVGQLQGISGQYAVRADGTLSVPLVGEVRVAGLTPTQLAALIADRLDANGIVSHPSATVVVALSQIK